MRQERYECANCRGVLKPHEEHKPRPGHPLRATTGKAGKCIALFHWDDGAVTDTDKR